MTAGFRFVGRTCICPFITLKKIIFNTAEIAMETSSDA
jgi:hypothetical protein